MSKPSKYAKPGQRVSSEYRYTLYNVTLKTRCPKCGRRETIHNCSVGTNDFEWLQQMQLYQHYDRGHALEMETDMVVCDQCEAKQWNRTESKAKKMFPWIIAIAVILLCVMVVPKLLNGIGFGSAIQVGYKSLVNNWAEVEGQTVTSDQAKNGLQEQIDGYGYYVGSVTNDYTTKVQKHTKADGTVIWLVDLSSNNEISSYTDKGYVIFPNKIIEKYLDNSGLSAKILTSETYGYGRLRAYLESFLPQAFAVGSYTEYLQKTHINTTAFFLTGEAEKLAYADGVMYYIGEEKEAEYTFYQAEQEFIFDVSDIAL